MEGIPQNVDGRDGKMGESRADFSNSYLKRRLLRREKKRWGRSSRGLALLNPAPSPCSTRPTRSGTSTRA